MTLSKYISLSFWSTLGILIVLAVICELVIVGISKIFLMIMYDKDKLNKIIRFIKKEDDQ